MRKLPQETTDHSHFKSDSNGIKRKVGLLNKWNSTGHKVTSDLKGSCHDWLSFYMWKGPFCWVQRYIFYPNPFSFSPSNQSKTKNPGTSKALETGYQERYWHPKMATRKGFSIQNWLPGKVLAPKTGYPEKYGHPKLATRKRDYR